MAETNYPPVGFYFKVSFQGGGINSETSFQEVSGLSVDNAPEEVTEGGVLQFRHRLPTTPKYSNLVLKRGLLTDSNLRQWIEKGINEFSFTPILVTVDLLNAEANPLMSWVLHNAWPVKWEVSSFDSMSNSLTVETFELAYDYFEAKTS
ncbi:MAG: phage tail protein [Bacteroidota bacterium]